MVPRIHEPRVLSSAQPIFGLFVIVIWTFILLPAQVFLLVLRLRVSDKICRLYFSGVCRIIGVNVHVFGNPKINRPILYLSNHSSWLDIPILGSQVEACFIAKAEVGRWPGIGFLAQLQRTEFVERKWYRSKLSSKNISDRLRKGARLMLFAEGTSTDGTYVLPFKSALLAAVEGAPEPDGPMVQPVTLVYVRINGEKPDRLLRNSVAWYGDMEFVSHFLGVFRLASVDVEVVFHEPVPEAFMYSRKVIASYCQSVISAEHARRLESLRLIDSN